MTPANLSPDDRALLVNLQYHDGFPVLVRVMEHACREATEAVIKCDPVERDRMAALQMEARAMNKFAAQIRKEFEYSMPASESDPEGE